MKLPKKVYLLIGILIFVAGSGVAFSLKPEPQKEFVQSTSVTQPTEETPVIVEQTPVPQSTPKQTVVQQVESEPAPQPINPFETNSPAWYVFNRRMQIGKTMPDGGTSYAKYCSNVAHMSSAIPKVHAIACTKTQVAFVEQINQDGTIWVSEMNSRGQVSVQDSTSAGGWGRVDYRLVAADQTASYAFID